MINRRFYGYITIRENDQVEKIGCSVIALNRKDAVKQIKEQYGDCTIERLEEQELAHDSGDLYDSLTEIEESLAELVDETPGLSADDKEILDFYFREHIQGEQRSPSTMDMAKELKKKFPEGKIRDDSMPQMRGEPSENKGIIAGYYLKYVVLPKAKEAFMGYKDANESTVNEDSSTIKLASSKIKFDSVTWNAMKHVLLQKHIPYTMASDCVYVPKQSVYDFLKVSDTYNAGFKYSGNINKGAERFPKKEAAVAEKKEEVIPEKVTEILKTNKDKEALHLCNFCALTFRATESICPTCKKIAEKVVVEYNTSEDGNLQTEEEMFEDEKAEHPTFTDEQIHQIVDDHMTKERDERKHRYEFESVIVEALSQKQVDKRVKSAKSVSGIWCDPPFSDDEKEVWSKIKNKEEAVAFHKKRGTKNIKLESKMDESSLMHFEKDGVKIVLVRKPETDEWVIKWYDNGKYSEDKTNYTSDKQDAVDTFNSMKVRIEKDDKGYVAKKSTVKEDMTPMLAGQKDTGKRQIVAKGIVDKSEAQRIASEKKGTVITDEQDEKKFAVVVTVQESIVEAIDPDARIDSLRDAVSTVNSAALHIAQDLMEIEQRRLAKKFNAYITSAITSLTNKRAIKLYTQIKEALRIGKVEKVEDKDKKEPVEKAKEVTKAPVKEAIQDESSRDEIIAGFHDIGYSLSEESDVENNEHVLTFVKGENIVEVKMKVID